MTLAKITAAAAVLAVMTLATARAQPAGPPTPAPVAPNPNCKIVRKAQLPLLESHGRFVTPVSINGAVLMMMIDTGAQRAAVSPQAQERLRLPVDTRRVFRAKGIGGAQAGQSARVARSIRFGPATWTEYPLAVINVSRPSDVNDPSAPQGVIGGDMLSGYDVEFDFPAHTMTLYTVTGCGGALIPWPGRYETLPIEPGPDDLLLTAMTVNGHRLRALVDTGSNATSLGLDAARLAGVDPSQLKDDTPDSVVGFKGVPVVAHRHRFDSIALGGTTYRNVTLSVQDANFGFADLLLGMDIMRGRKVWLSYATRQVFMQPLRVVRAGPPPVVARPAATVDAKGLAAPAP